VPTFARLAAVIKVGGSLADNTQHAARNTQHTTRAGLEQLCQTIAELGQRYRLLVVPGGGPFADTVRAAYRRYRLSETTAHCMAILAMDQYGYLLADLIPAAEPVVSLMAMHRVCDAGRVPVLIPSELVLYADPLPHSWDVTSDSIAAWLAGLVRPDRLVLLKDVDGLYVTDPAQSPTRKLVAEVPIDELSRYPGVDATLGQVLAYWRVETWVINGLYPARLVELLEQGETLGTRLRY
jgi:aspartokinase-like uncharacterized kinase